MSLDNLHCPQFVDFTVADTFDINDGADFFFEKGVVGELGMQMDLGLFGNSEPMRHSDPVQDITEKISNMSTMTPKLHNTKEKTPLSALNQEKPNRPVTRNSIKESGSTEDKENQQKTPQYPTSKTIDEIQKPSKDIGASKLDSAISSAIEMILSTNNSQNKDTPYTPVTQKIQSESCTPPQPDSLRESLASKKSDEENVNKSSTPVYNETEPASGETGEAVLPSDTTPEPPKSIGSSSALSKPTTATLNKQKVPVVNSTNPSIVKKTLAKMTAAFKQTKPIVVQSGSQLANKRANYTRQKPSSVTNSDARSGRLNTSGNVTPKPATNSQNFKNRNDSNNNESRLARPMSPEAGSNRRCSSVPRTLRERQALNNSRQNTSKTSKNTFGEKIQNFFNSNNKSKSQQKTSIQHKSVKNTKEDLKDRRRSRSVNESINVSKAGTPGITKTNSHTRRVSQNDSINTSKTTSSQANKSSYTKITASPSFTKPRQKSSERNLPQGVTSLYTGVKFVTNTTNSMLIKKKYNENLQAFSSSNTTTAQSSVLGNTLGPLPVENILKNRPNCMKSTTKPISANPNLKKPSNFMRTTPGKSASFRSSSNSTSISKSHPKSNMSDYALNVSVDKTALNSSASNASRVRKQSDSNSSMNQSGYLRTELRALKRNEYEQQLKEKEKMAAIIKHELDQEKLKKQQEEIQKIRNQRNFRSNPIRSYKPIQLKPSDKSLTEPKSPHLSTSTIRLNDISRNQDSTHNMSSSHRLSMALVDAPLIKKSANSNNQSVHSSRNTARVPARNRAASQNDLRF